MLRPITQRARAIAEDRVLRWTAAIFALVHGLTAMAWLSGRAGVPLPQILGPGSPALCWPFAPGCAAWRGLDADALRDAVLGYGALGVVAAALWLARRAQAAWLLHLALELIKLAFVFQDYRLRLNEHHMALFAAMALLLLPAPRDALRVMLVLFYVAAGFLKLSPDWLAGAALPMRPLFVPASLVPWACRYVVVLEIVFAWGLLARRPLLFWGALVQLALFHLSSFSVVGFFYPTLMFMLLAIFPLARWDERERTDSVLTRLQERELPVGAYVGLAIFLALQVVPRLYPGDPALTGEGRWLALHMFDARVDCRAALMPRESTQFRGKDLMLPDAPRIRCDPLVVRARALVACQSLDPSTRWDLVLDARRSTDAHGHRLVDQPDFCRAPPPYRALGHNAWIHVD